MLKHDPRLLLAALLRRILWQCAAIVATALALWSCNATKHVPEGEYLLDKVSIQVDNDTIKETELYNFLRQMPNHKVLGCVKLQLATYNLSGADSSKWYNRWLQKVGQAPVIFSQEATEISANQLRQALVNRGYMSAEVEIDTIANGDKQKMEVNYLVTTGLPHRISSVTYNIPDAHMREILNADRTLFSIKNGDLFDRNKLDNFRGEIATALRNNGYYDFNKDYITFIADTVLNSKEVELTMTIKEPAQSPTAAAVGTPLPKHNLYRIRDVFFVTDYDPRETNDNFNFAKQDTVHYKHLTILYGKDHYIVPSILDEKCYIYPGQEYSAANVERTYESLSQLGIIKFINVEMRPVGMVDGVQWLDAYVLLSRNQKQSVTLDLEGTNSEGDLGFGVGLTYQHRNLQKKSNLLTVKFRTAYESLSGNVQGFINNRYSEYAGEVGITFPKFELPFVSQEYKKRRRANTEFAVSFNYQERPEYTRIMLGAAWKYKWSHRRGSNLVRHNFDLIDVNYVKLPKSTINFLDSIAPANPLLRYSYEDHFIMRMGYTFHRSNKRIPTATTNAFAIQPYVETVRGAVEIAGNLLYAISSIIGQQRSDGAYKIFGIQYAQYVKGEADYSYAWNLNSRNCLAFHIGGGIAVPYLNSKMVPFEKRFYAGGANSVRGWGVRSLGPGSYDSKNSVSAFINQCGDILLNMNVEYRAKLFWVFDGALFVDAGNIWTIRNYENQPGGVFRFNRFYKQIAAAYGIGIRLDFTYFLLRFDLGMKAHNPAVNQEPWPLLHPSWKRDANFHFSVGYPF